MIIEAQDWFVLLNIFVDQEGIAALMEFQQDNSNTVPSIVFSSGDGLLEAAEC